MHAHTQLRRALVVFAALLVVPIALGCAAQPQGETTPPPARFESERIHPEAQVRIPVPADWKVDDATPGVLVMTDPAEEVALLFRVTEAQDLAGALGGLALGILSEIDDVKLVGDPQNVDINGMQGLVQDGSGRYQGQAVELSVAAILTPTGKYLLVVGVADSGQLASHEQELLKIVNGLRPNEG